MKPIELELAWFGQYTVAQTLKFGALDSVFLITGETGAGKTTLFDAMTYALYGRGLGARSHGESLRSQLAGEEHSTYVRFRFEVNGVVWEAKRSPYSFVRVKRTGKVEIDKYAAVVRLSGEGAHATIPPGQVAGTILKVIGLKYDDFSKILVLPQGEFQQFLAMKTKDRAELLKTLFPVGRHTELARLAKESVREVTKRADELDTAAKEAGRDFNEASYPQTEAAMVSRLALLLAEEESLVEAHKEAERALHSAKTLAGQLLTRAKRQEERERHEETRPQQEASRVQLFAGRRAAAVLPFVERVEALRADINRIAGLRMAAEAEKSAAIGVRDSLQSAADMLPARDERLRDAGIVVERLVARLADLRTLKNAREDEARLRIAADRAAAAVDPTGVAVAEAAVVALDALAADKQALEPTLAAARDRVQSCRLSEPDANACVAWTTQTLPAGQAQTKQEEARLTQLVTAEQATNAELSRTRAHLEADAALLVAAALEPGKPCPACGSPDHPAPRTGDPTKGDAGALVRSAEKVAASTREARSTQERLLTEIGARLKAARDTAEAAAARLVAARHADPSGWKSAFEQAKATLMPLESADADLTRRLAQRPARVADLTAARRAAEDQAALAQRAQTALAAAAGATAVVEARVGVVPDIDPEIQAVDAQQRAAAADNAAEAIAIRGVRTQWETAEAAVIKTSAKANTLASEEAGKAEQLPAADAAATDALREYELASVEQARAAFLVPRDLEALQTKVSAWDRDLASFAEVIAELDLGIAGRSAPDVPAAALAEQAAGSAANEAAEKRRDGDNALAALRGKKARIDELRAEREALLADKRGLVTLSKHLNGDVAPKIDFPTWILTWWLERVLAQANRRMSTLSDSRYLFRLRTKVEDGRSCAGLDVDVLDTWSNQLRDVNLLSGGEKFLASLSLALGLADVVQGLNGGVQLNTLFIDEGFGSLDPTTLDRSMDLINQIAEHRAVGLISHVEAMQKSIPSQIRVTKSPGGSVAKVFGGAE